MQPWFAPPPPPPPRPEQGSTTAPIELDGEDSAATLSSDSDGEGTNTRLDESMAAARASLLQAAAERRHHATSPGKKRRLPGAATVAGASSLDFMLPPSRAPSPSPPANAAELIASSAMPLRPLDADGDTIMLPARPLAHADDGDDTEEEKTTTPPPQETEPRRSPSPPMWISMPSTPRSVTAAEESPLLIGLTSVPSLRSPMTELTAPRAWICGTWLGRCEISFKAVYFSLQLWSTGASPERIWHGTMQYTHLRRLSLSRPEKAAHIVLELFRGLPNPPTFTDFYDSMFARITQEQIETPMPDLYGIILFFDDDLELARCQSMGSVSALLATKMQVPITEDEATAIGRLNTKNVESVMRPSVLSTISGKVKGTFDAISSFFSPEKRQKLDEAEDTGVLVTGKRSRLLNTDSIEGLHGRRRRARRSLLPSDCVETVVQLTDNENDGSRTSTTSERRSTRASTQLLLQQSKQEAERRADARKSKLLLSYPFEDSDLPGRISITLGDIDRLSPGEFLNDTIIDFYQRYLWRHLEVWQQKQVYFFSSHFFTQLSGGNLNDKSVAIDDRFARVARWTQKEHIFAKKFIIIPINYSCHWSVAVVCNPGSAVVHKRIKQSSNRQPNGSVNGKSTYASEVLRETIVIDTTEEASDTDEEQELDWCLKERQLHPPCILFFDSLKCHQKKRICSLVQRYLECEYRARFDGVNPQSGNFEDSDKIRTTFDHDSVKIVEPDVPLQSNSSDCGVFLLMYIAQILQRYPAGITREDLDSNLSSSISRTMFDDSHVQEFRDYLHQLIFTLQRIQRRGESEVVVKDEGLESFLLES